MNIKNITYAGNHGLDIVHPDGTKFVPPLPEEVNPIPKTSPPEVEKENDSPRCKMESLCQGGVESKLVASEAASRMLPGATDDELRIM